MCVCVCACVPKPKLFHILFLMVYQAHSSLPEIHRIHFVKACGELRVKPKKSSKMFFKKRIIFISYFYSSVYNMCEHEYTQQACDLMTCSTCKMWNDWKIYENIRLRLNAKPKANCGCVSYVSLFIIIITMNIFELVQGPFESSDRFDSNVINIESFGNYSFRKNNSQNTLSFMLIFSWVFLCRLCFLLLHFAFFFTLLHRV